ncbi:RsmE family RNA methyltransferase [Simkania sp.]|uniref:RsmE family RNA methyltransferase n=1 Tax=Simkania sp. TaxID=34094 RepID=UPI003B5276F9
MPADRFYLKESFNQGDIVFLEEEEFHHLSRVMRKKEGDAIELVNGMGALAQAKLLQIEKRKASLEILETSKHEPLLPPLILIQALPKLSHLDWIIQKGTELGASSFYLFPSERSEKDSLSNNQWKRLKLIAIGAMKQCGRLDLPSIHFASDLDGLSLPEGHAFFGDPEAEISLPKGKAPYLLFIGPEKGFSHEEYKNMREKFKAQAVKLHPYILRAETAAIAALTLASAL